MNPFTVIVALEDVTAEDMLKTTSVCPYALICFYLQGAGSISLLAAGRKAAVDGCKSAIDR